jgi:hypothetical protein
MNARTAKPSFALKQVIVAFSAPSGQLSARRSNAAREDAVFAVRLKHYRGA